MDRQWLTGRRISIETARRISESLDVVLSRMLNGCFHPGPSRLSPESWGWVGVSPNRRIVCLRRMNP